MGVMSVPASDEDLAKVGLAVIHGMPRVEWFVYRQQRQDGEVEVAVRGRYTDPADGEEYGLEYGDVDGECALEAHLAEDAFSVLVGSDTDRYRVSNVFAEGGEGFGLAVRHLHGEAGGATGADRLVEIREMILGLLAQDWLARRGLWAARESK